MIAHPTIMHLAPTTALLVEQLLSTSVMMIFLP